MINKNRNQRLDAIHARSDADHESTVANAESIGARIAPTFFAKSQTPLLALLAPFAAEDTPLLTKEIIVITRPANPPTTVDTNAIILKFLLRKSLKRLNLP